MSTSQSTPTATFDGVPCRYAVRKFSGRHDYITRWGVVRIIGKREARVRFSETSDRDDAQDQADTLNGVERDEC